MSSYETTAIVEQQGRVHLDHVPFEPGTEVEVTIRTKSDAEVNGSSMSDVEPGESLRDVFARARPQNAEPIGPLRRVEIYDRKIFR